MQQLLEMKFSHSLNAQLMFLPFRVEQWQLGEMKWSGLVYALLWTDYSLRYAIYVVLASWIKANWIYLLFVPHGPLSPNHNFTACLLFQLFGRHPSRTQNPAHKVKLKRKNCVRNVITLKVRCSNLYVWGEKKYHMLYFPLQF